MIEWNSNNAASSAAFPRTPDQLAGPAQLRSLVASSPRPFVLINERELSVLRRGLTKDGWKRSLYLQPAKKLHDIYTGGSLLSIANRWLETDISIPERSGHYHDFFCECGNRFTIPEDLQTGGEYKCSVCGNTAQGTKYDGAVRYIHHQMLAGAAISLAIIYAIERDKAYADKAAEILVKYAEAYPGPHTDAVTGGMMHQSLCEAVWIIPLAQAYDLLYYSRSLSDAQKEMIERRLFRSAAEGLRNMGTVGNWGSWHLSAVGVVGLAVRDVELVEYALNAFAQQISEQLGDDGLWPESVHTYHFYPLSAFVHFAEACYRAGLDLYNWQPKRGKSLKAMFEAPLAYMYPSFRLPAINDGWYHSFLPLDLYEIAHRRWSDPSFAWALKSGYKFGEHPINEDQAEHSLWLSRNSFYAFLFGRDLPGRSPSPVFGSHNFSSLGICTLRNSDNAMVTLDYGPFLGHGHLDKLSFTFYANNTLLIPDYGTPGYGARVTEYYRSTAAHNTVVVDGLSQAPASKPGLVARYSGDLVQYVDAVADDCYTGVQHERRILLFGNNCVVRDYLTSDESHNYDWFVRCEGKPEIQGKYEPWEGDALEYDLLDYNELFQLTGEFALKWRFKQSELAFAIWTGSGRGRVALGGCPAETTEKRASFSLCRETGQNAAFTSVLASSESGNVVLKRSGSVITIEDGDNVDYLLINGAGMDDTDSRFKTDGEVAIVRIQNGEVKGLALIRGSYIEWDGELILECPSRVECVEIYFHDRSPSMNYCGGEPGTLKLKTKSRAMRVNGHRTAASNSTGHAMLRITHQMLNDDSLLIRS